MAAEEAVRREHRATKMVAELTAIVREQKGRLVELGRAKEDTVNELRVREREGERERGIEGAYMSSIAMGTVRPKSKQGNTTNLNISFSMENEKIAAQVGSTINGWSRDVRVAMVSVVTLREGRLVEGTQCCNTHTLMMPCP